MTPSKKPLDGPHNVPITGTAWLVAGALALGVGAALAQTGATSDADVAAESVEASDPLETLADAVDQLRSAETPGAGAPEPDGEVALDQLSGRVDELERALGDAMAGLSADLQTLQVRLSDQRDDVTVVRDDLQALVGQVGDVGGQLRALERQLAAAGDDDASIRDLTAAVAALEAGQARLTTTLEAVRLVAARGGDNNAYALAEVGYLLRLAQHKLALQQDAAGGRQALMAARDRLAAVDSGPFAPVVAAIDDHLTALEGVDAPDYGLLMSRLHGLGDRLGQLPLPAVPTMDERLARVAPPASATPPSADLWGEVLASVRRIPEVLRSARRTTDPVDLAASVQRELLEQNIALRLGAAQQALASREPAAYRAALTQAIEDVQGHFDPDSASVQTFIERAEQLRDQPLALELPDVSATVANFEAIASRRGAANGVQP
ncbi:MAG: uroporphyrinogen-III C-methyltransferase [Candidatus Competibacterales bacterium]